MPRSADDLIAGVGLLYVAPTTAAAPTGAFSSGTTPIDVLSLTGGWREVGYTDGGSTFTTSITTENLEVAEELEPVGVLTASRSGAVAFSMAQATADNLALALNLGAAVTKAGSTAIEPPDPADEQYISLILQTNQKALWYVPKLKNTAEFSLPRVKSGKTLIPVTMGMFKIPTRKLFTVWRGNNGAI